MRAAEIATLAQLAAADGLGVPRANDATFAGLRRRARPQLDSRGKPVPAFEGLTPDETDRPRGMPALGVHSGLVDLLHSGLLDF